MGKHRGDVARARWTNAGHSTSRHRLVGAGLTVVSVLAVVAIASGRGVPAEVQSAPSQLAMPSRSTGSGEVFDVSKALPALDNNSRASMRSAYLNILKPAIATPIGWTGSTAGCRAGAPSSAAQTATLNAVNYYRAMVDLPAVTFDPALSAKAQQAALMMAAAEQLSHTPGPSWPCYTAAGAEAAGASNLSLGWGIEYGAAKAIAGQMTDGGANNTAVGHRRWIQSHDRSVMGAGSTKFSNALYVFGRSAKPANPPEWVSWPSAGYFPEPIEPNGRWSLSATDPTTSFASARVAVTTNGVTLPVSVKPVAFGYGDPTLVWELDTRYSGGATDRPYVVTVTNIKRGSQTLTHSYTVKLFDPAVDRSQSISFGSLPGRTYGSAPFTVTAKATSGLPVSFTSTTTSICTTSGTRGTTVTLRGVGTCAIRASQAGSNSVDPAPWVTKTFNVAKGSLIVRALDVLRAPGASNPGFSVSYGGFAAGESLATSGVTGAPVCTTTATSGSPVGAYPITCALGSLASSKYHFVLGSSVLYVANPGGSFEVVSPRRLADSRAGSSTADGLWAGFGSLGSGSSPSGVVGVPVLGRGGVPGSGVGSVVLNVVALGSTDASSVAVWPSGVSRPVSSVVNFGAGETVSNMVVAKVGADGRVNVGVRAGRVHVIVEVLGWFPSGGSFEVVSPRRLADSRAGSSTADGLWAGFGSLGSGSSPSGVVGVPVLGRGGVPGSGVGSVVLNVVALGSTDASSVAVWPSGVSRPVSSVVNFGAGETVSNMVVAKVGADGRVNVGVRAGRVHVIVEVLGWFP